MSHEHHHHDEPAGAGSRALNEALNSAFHVLRGVMILLALAYLASGIFVVKPEEKAVVLVFGKVSGLGEERIKGPGLHWTWPRPFSEIVRLKAGQVQTINVDTFWYKQEGGSEDNAAPPPALDPARDGCLIAGDADLFHTLWSVRYTIAQPDTYSFNWTAVATVLRQELERAATRAAADTPIDRALRTDIEGFRAAVENELRLRCEQLGLGIRIQGVDLTAAVPPLQVAQAFDDVTRAEMDRAQQISDARAYATRTANEASGEADKIRAEGRAYEQKIVTQTAAEADYFKKVLVQYRKNPAVVRAALLDAGIQTALSGVTQKYIVPAGSGEIRVQLSPETKKIGTAQ